MTTPRGRWTAIPHPNVESGWTIFNDRSRSWASTCFASKAGAEAQAQRKNGEAEKSVSYPSTAREA